MVLTTVCKQKQIPFGNDKQNATEWQKIRYGMANKLDTAIPMMFKL